MNFEKLKQKDAAKAVGVTVKTLQRWTVAGCPRNPDESYSLPRLVEWLIDRERDQITPSVGATSTDETWLELYRMERYRIAEIERKKLEGDLVPRSEIAPQWSARVLEVGTGLYALANRLPPLLEAKSQREMAAIVRAEVRKLHESYSRTGRFCMVDDLPKPNKR